MLNNITPFLFFPFLPLIPFSLPFLSPILPVMSSVSFKLPSESVESYPILDPDHVLYTFPG